MKKITMMLVSLWGTTYAMQGRTHHTEYDADRFHHAGMQELIKNNKNVIEKIDSVWKSILCLFAPETQETIIEMNTACRYIFLWGKQSTFETYRQAQDILRMHGIVTSQNLKEMMEEWIEFSTHTLAEPLLDDDQLIQLRQRSSNAQLLRDSLVATSIATQEELD